MFRALPAWFGVGKPVLFGKAMRPSGIEISDLSRITIFDKEAICTLNITWMRNCYCRIEFCSSLSDSLAFPHHFSTSRHWGFIRQDLAEQKKSEKAQRTGSAGIWAMPPKINSWNLKMMVWFRWFSSSRGVFSGSMLILRGVMATAIQESRKKQIQQHYFYKKSSFRIFFHCFFSSCPCFENSNKIRIARVPTNRPRSLNASSGGTPSKRCPSLFRGCQGFEGSGMKWYMLWNAATCRDRNI